MILWLKLECCSYFSCWSRALLKCGIDLTELPSSDQKQFDGGTFLMLQNNTLFTKSDTVLHYSATLNLPIVIPTTFVDFPEPSSTVICGTPGNYCHLAQKLLRITYKQVCLRGSCNRHKNMLYCPYKLKYRPAPCRTGWFIEYVNK